MKHVEVEYIESGTFQGGEEDVSKAGIEYGEDCVAMSKKEHAKLLAERQALREALKGTLYAIDFDRWPNTKLAVVTALALAEKEVEA